MIATIPAHVRPAGKQCPHHRYVLTCEDFDELWWHAGGRCQMCGRLAEETPTGRLVIDHDGRLGRWAVRGLLCNRCNTSAPVVYGQPGNGIAILDNPWYRHLLDRAGVGLTIPEPPLGTLIDAGSGQYRRDRGGWQLLRHAKRPDDPMTWERLVQLRGPHRIRVIGFDPKGSYCRQR